MVPIVEVLIVAGFHVPLIPLFDVDGNAGGVVLLHNGGIWVKVGITCDVIATSSVAVAAHCPAAGVNV